MFQVLKNQSPARIFSLGFALIILLGSALLMLPISVNEGVDLNYMDALYTSTSAVCVTGLIAVDTADTFTVFGRTVVALLIQIGGLGVTVVGAGIILAIGKKINLKGRRLIKEAMNLDSGKGMIRFIKGVLLTTFVFELLGAVLSFVVFVQDYPAWQALGISVFHAVAAFNNSGFDILGGLQNLIPYQDNILLNLVTCGLIIFGGIGFLVIKDIWDCKFRFKKLHMHAKVVITVSLFLIAAGTILIKLTENITWLGAFFNSVSARTAGFSTFPLGKFSNAGLSVLTVLMFIGASPGSTGGGIKTSTLFVLMQGVKSAATNKSSAAFHYSVPADSLKKATVITILAAGTVCLGTYLMSVFEPQLNLMDILFEVTSAFGTVGLSTGITPGLSVPSKLLSVLIMFIGRLGPLTIASVWYFADEQQVRYPEGNIAIG